MVGRRRRPSTAGIGTRRRGSSDARRRREAGRVRVPARRPRAIEGPGPGPPNSNGAPLASLTLAGTGAGASAAATRNARWRRSIDRPAATTAAISTDRREGTRATGGTPYRSPPTPGPDIRRRSPPHRAAIGVARVRPAATRAAVRATDRRSVPSAPGSGGVSLTDRPASWTTTPRAPSGWLTPAATTDSWWVPRGFR